MANEILYKGDTATIPQVVFADHAGDFSPTDNKWDHRSANTANVQLSLASVADAAARNSTLCTLPATRAPEYQVVGVIETDGANVAADASIDLYWSPQPTATAAKGAPGGEKDTTFGTDGAYAPAATDSVAEGVARMQYIGSMSMYTLGASGEPQVGYVGVFSPPTRYGTLVVVNNSGDGLQTDDVEMAIYFNPIIPEVQ